MYELLVRETYHDELMWLCVPNCSMYELLVRETYHDELMWHFGITKTLEVLHEYFYWPNIKRDLQRFFW
jgi:hypothetical protein